MRGFVATVGGSGGFVAYVAAVVVLGDRVTDAHWLVQAVFFLLAGTLWAFPATWLIRWAVRG